MFTHWKSIAVIVGAGIAVSGIIVWVVYINRPEVPPTVIDTFGSSDTRSSVAAQSSNIEDSIPSTNGVLPSGERVVTPIFKINDGPVAGAIFLQATRPTSTIARYIMATNGHTFDLLIDAQGAAAKNISNTTIPGITEATWSNGGRGVLLRYLDKQSLKTVFLALPTPNSSTTTSGSRIQFLPSGVTSLAVSPDGTKAAYLLQTATGVDGYVSDTNGSRAAKLFSLPLSQIHLQWPSQAVLLAETASGAGIPGVVFSINATTGAWAPLIYAEGITALANRDFSRVLYHTAGETRASYYQNTETGLSRPLSYSPIPELCTWGVATSTITYCAVPLTYVEPNYLDLFHYGLQGASMGIVKYDLQTGRSMVIAQPGGEGGGVAGEIISLSLSPDEKYLLYIQKNSRSLWGVRLTE